MLGVRFNLTKVFVFCPLFLALLLVGCATGGGVGSAHEAVQAPRIIYFKATPPNTIPGKPVTLEWRTDNAVRTEIEGVGGVPLQGSKIIVPDRPFYVLAASNEAGQTTQEEVYIGGTDVPIMATPPPQVIFFRANPPSVMAGNTTDLEWRAIFAESVEISGLGEVPLEGRRSVDPQHRSTYQLTARNSKGETATEEVTVMVAFPRIIVEPQPGESPPLRIEEPIRVYPHRVITPGTLQMMGSLPAPRLISPANGARFDHYPRETNLRWSRVQGAESYSVEVQFCQRAECTNGAQPFKLQERLPSTEYVFDFIGAQPGRWRVWAVDRNQKAGRKSEWWEFHYTR